ncbi:MAG TPA: DUF748 domain-containing protein, partial [Candidatus Binataceae bacterium]|nr:DUF748 domain-containing protein [Candidatus Binataceae bacterium]
MAGSRRLRAAVVIVCAAMAIFTLGGFFGVPFLLSYLARGRLAAAIHRQVTIGTVRFNPYTLRLSIDHLHVGERDGPQAFSDISQIRVKASWQSLYRFAPIIEELTVEHPRVHLIRISPDRFNCSDLMARSEPPQAAPPGKPFHFAVSNIRIEGGQVWFEDRVLHEQHAADRIQIGLPFIANLPADVDIFVEPMVRMQVDGSPFRVAGIAKPFASTPESDLDLKLKRLDLPRYAAYLTQKLPIKVPHGTLTTDVQVHFIQPQSGPVIRLGGSVEIDGLDVRDGSGAPLAAFKRATVALNNIEPLGNIVSLGAIRLDGFTSNLVLKSGGATNFTPLAAAFAGPPRHSPPPEQQGAPLNLTLQSLEVSNGALKFIDSGTPVPVVMALDNIHVGVKNFASGKQAAPFAFETQARLGAGSLAVKGALDLAHSQVTTEVSVDKIDLPPLQAFAQPFWAGTIASGKLGAHAKLQTMFAAGRFNVRVQPAIAALDAVELRAPAQDEKPVQLAHLSLAIDQFDLAARQVALKEVRIDGLHGFVRRLHDGQFGIKSFLRTLAARSPAQPGDPPPAAVEHQSVVIAPADAAHPAATPARPAPAQPAAAPAQPWRYRIESVAIENTDATLEDDVPVAPVTLHLAPLNLHLKDVSNDLTKPIGIEIDGSTPQGTFKIDGTAVPAPLKTDLHLAAQRLDVAPVDNYLGSQLNVRLTRATLSLKGDLEVAGAEGKFRGSYRGAATLGNLRLIDKVTGDRFLRWSALSASRIDAAFGAGPPAVQVGALGLSDFYTRLILNSNGKLNLRDIVGNPKSAPTSVT